LFAETRIFELSIGTGALSLMRISLMRTHTIKAKILKVSVPTITQSVCPYNYSDLELYRDRALSGQAP